MYGRSSQLKTQLTRLRIEDGKISQLPVGLLTQLVRALHPGIAEVRVPIPAKLNFKLRLYRDHDLLYINLFIPRFIYSSLQLWHSPSKGGLHIWRELVK